MKKLTNSITKYRPEIDGLRAFAIVTVIINHFNKDILPSGYLGVDIFFVISGYVITSSLSNRKSKNLREFLSGFYERRIKRLVPALVSFVLIASFLICFFQQNPSISLKTGMASLFGLSNFYLLLRSTDYFSQATELNVFTHTWSLGVEEQFYILFPLITWMTGFSRQTSRGARNLLICLLFLIIVSFLAFIYLYSKSQPAAYFLMPTRFWEMAIGCIIFLTLQNEVNIIKKIESTPPFIILISMIGVMFLPISFAVLSTTLIVLLTCLLLFCLKPGQSLFKFFTNKNIVFIGLISYSLYLWHWGILSISRWTIGVHWWSIPFQLSIIILLAITSHKWIETPLRKIDWSLKKSKTITKGIITLIVSALTLFVLGKPFKEKLFLGDIQSDLTEPFFEKLPISKDCHEMSFKKGYKHAKVLNHCLTKDVDKKRTLFFLGDSHNKYFWRGAEFISQSTNSNLFTFSYGAISFPSIKYFRLNNKERDLRINKIVNIFEKNILLNLKKGDILFITTRLPYYFGEDWYEHPANSFRFFDENDQIISRNSKSEYFEKWLKAFRELTEYLLKMDVKVVISTPTPEFPKAILKQCKGQNDQWFNKLSRKDCSISRDFFLSNEGKYSFIINRLKKITSEYQNLYLFDAFNAMCPNEKCQFKPLDNSLYIDNDHISNYAARYILAPKMINFLEQEEIISF